MLKKYTYFFKKFFAFVIFGFILFTLELMVANATLLNDLEKNKIKLVSQNNINNKTQDNIILTDLDKSLDEIIDNQQLAKPVEEITVPDIIKGEDVSPEIRDRITRLINQSQYQLDSYRSVISASYKQLENKVIAYRNELNDIYDFKDEMEANLNLSKWMIISLSVGIICLTTIVIIMWRSVVNVNRNDVEVLFSAEKIKKDLRLLSKRLDLLENNCKKDEDE